MRFSSSSSLCQILGWSVLVRVDGLTYSFLGDVVGNLYNFTVNSTSITITPTQTVVTAQAGPMQVNLTFLNPIEVRFHSSVTSMSTYALSQAPRLGQAIYPILILGFHRNFHGRPKSRCAGVFRCQRRYVLSFSGVRLCTSANQLRYRVELRGSIAEDSVEFDVQCRCHLPPCHTPDPGCVHRGNRPSGMGNSILCHEGRA